MSVRKEGILMALTGMFTAKLATLRLLTAVITNMLMLSSYNVYHVHHLSFAY